MKLQKEYIHMCHRREMKMTQVTLDEDLIVPDSRPDLEDIVMTHGEVRTEEPRAGSGRVGVKGALAFAFLYRASDGSMQRLEGSLPFEETVNVAETSDRDHWKVDWDLEDLSIEKIHSRKVSVRAIVTLMLTASQLQDAELAVGVQSEEPVDMMTRPVELAQLSVQTTDSYRFREEVELEHNRPNVKTILWEKCDLRNWEVRPLDGALRIRGEMALFVIYAGEEPHIPLQYIEKYLPFSSEMELASCTEEMVPDVSVFMGKPNISVKPDYDGEMRTIEVEAILELDMELYEEKTVDVLEDVYCPSKEIGLETQHLRGEKLLIKNVTRMKVGETIALGENRRLLQICHTDGALHVDRVDPQMDHLVLEGALTVQILYLEANDEQPFRTHQGAIPVRISIEAKGMTPQSRCRVKGVVEQLGAVMLGGGEVEIKAVVAAELLAWNEMPMVVISGLEEHALDRARLEAMPGMCGYIVQPGDTLWKIAKECGTTVERLRQMNSLSADPPAPGERLFVVKEALYI